MMEQGYIWIENGVVQRRFPDGTSVPLNGPFRKRKIGRSDGVWQRSESNGLIGTKADLKKAQAIDAKLGVPIDYKPVKKRGQMTAYVAEFADARQKNNWLRAHKRVDYDAGYGAPCPGDFRGQCRPEFES